MYNFKRGTVVKSEDGRCVRLSGRHYVSLDELMVIMFPEEDREEWRDILIDGAPTDYEVSCSGAVRCKRNRHRLSPSLNVRKGFYYVSLRHGGETLSRLVHRLVADAFLENPEGFRFVRHIDGNKRNNAADNLEWCRGYGKRTQ